MITGFFQKHLQDQDHSTVDERQVLQQKVREVFKLSGYSEINAKSFRSDPFSRVGRSFFGVELQDWMRPRLDRATYIGPSPFGG